MPEPGSGWGWFSSLAVISRFKSEEFCLEEMNTCNCWLLELVRRQKRNSWQRVFLCSPSPSIPENSFLSLPELGFELPSLFPDVDAPFLGILFPTEGSGAPIGLALGHSQVCFGGEIPDPGRLLGNFFTIWAALEEGFWAGIGALVE